MDKINLSSSDKISPVFDVTDGPSGIKYISYFNFLNEFFKNGKSCDFAYMNFADKNPIINQVIDKIKAYSIENGMQYFLFNKSIFTYNNEVFVHCGYGRELNDTVFQLELQGNHEVFETIFSLVRDIEYTKPSKSSIQWFYRGPQGIESKNIYLDKNVRVAESLHYPFLKKPVDEFMEDYIQSDASVMILTGVPGGGKTTLIRHMIHKYHLNAYVTFDESIIREDNFFVRFITDSESQLLVVEDADTLLGSRDDAKNDIMAKFLNVSDGLVQHKNKKLIFTTNFTNVNRIDSALVRPGRCYGVFEFKHLTADQANTIRAKHDLPPLEGANEYTLSQVFNKSESTVKRKAMGLI